MVLFVTVNRSELNSTMCNKKFSGGKRQGISSVRYGSLVTFLEKNFNKKAGIVILNAYVDEGMCNNTNKQHISSSVLREENKHYLVCTMAVARIRGPHGSRWAPYAPSYAARSMCTFALRRVVAPASRRYTVFNPD